MECNKDEAVRAKEIAIKKLIEKDIIGAKKFAVKAQNLFPELEGISQFLATLDVYISAERKSNGEVDWYGVLGVDSSAGEDTIRKSYRRMALSLHPDKNKSPGAEGAFKFVSEAWSVLSDKSKKIAYDQKHNLRNIYQKVPVGRNGFHSCPTNNYHHIAPRPQTNTASPFVTRPNPATTAPVTQKPNTFWTVCFRCKVQYEYLRIYLNTTLLCPTCRMAFTATELPTPPTSLASPWPEKHQQRNAQSANLGGRSVQSRNDKLKRGREEGHEAPTRQDVLRRKNHSSRKAGTWVASGLPGAGTDDGSVRRSHLGGVATVSQKSSHGFGMGTLPGFQKIPSPSQNAGTSSTTRLNGMRELSHSECCNMLMDKARRSIRQKLTELKSVASTSETSDTSKASMTLDTLQASKTSDRLQTSNKWKTSKKIETEKKEKTPGFTGDSLGTEMKRSGESLDNSVKDQSTKSSIAVENTASDTKDRNFSMIVPDPDFHDFDKDRTENSFDSNQVWAAYDDDDGMPRYYAIIHRVISLKPFKMQISWLNSRSNSELAPLNWIGSGFYKTAGDFRTGRYEVYKSLNAFSHKVNWRKGARGIINIYPKKGDVWAIYRNWSPDWNRAETPEEVIHRYEMVEVLDDYDESIGVTVAQLVKVAGFKTVFCRHPDPKAFLTIPKEELFRLSHQVPSYLFTGEEFENAPKDCRELDPAGMPLELLQVVTDSKEEEVQKRD